MYYPRWRKLALAIALQSIASVPVVAQNVVPDEIVVTAQPIRDSETAAINAKRNADNTVEIIAADTIGRFPDQNLADSLGRLPGLAIERDQGQARYINLRGTPFRYTSIAFDNINVPGAQGGRTPRFDSFPSVITSRLEVNKAILPSMPGESIAGYININTFNPFDKNGWSLAGDTGFGEQQLGGGDIEKLSLRLSWSGDNLGVMLFGSQNSREQITDNREFDLNRDPGGQIKVNELDFRSYRVTREDKARGGRVEYRGDDVLQSVFVSSLYSEFTDMEERNQFVFAFSDSQPGLAQSEVSTAVSRSLEDGDYTNSTFTNTLGSDLQLGEWLVKGRLNHTQTEFGMNLPIIMSRGGSTQAAYDIRNSQDPLVNLDTPLEDVAYASNLALHYVQALDVDTDQVKLDAERAMSWFDREAMLRFGGQFQAREGKGFVATANMGAFPAAIDIGQFNTGKRWHANTTNSIGGTYYDNIGLRDAWEAMGGLQTPQVAAENAIQIEEDIAALYAMLTTDFDWGNFVIGARYEATEYTSEGSNLDGPVSVSDDFSNFLPSAHLNLDLSDTLKLRLSASTGISRPDYNEWRASAALDINNRQIRGGNPTLKAEEARGLDVSLEWYFAPASLLSAGFFHRSIDNVIYADSSSIDAGVYLPGAAGETWTYTGNVNGNNGKLQGLEFNFIGHATELLPTAFDGLGISANITLLDTEFEGIDGVKYGLPGTSDLIYNASLFYEKYDASIRLNYQYRDEWISPIEDPSEYWGEQQRVDLAASYTLPVDFGGAMMSVYANVNNLTNETDDRFAGNGTINQSESYGRHYMMGLRFNY